MIRPSFAKSQPGEDTIVLGVPPHIMNVRMTIRPLLCNVLYVRSHSTLFWPTKKEQVWRRGQPCWSRFGRRFSRGTVRSTLLGDLTLLTFSRAGCAVAYHRNRLDLCIVIVVSRVQLPSLSY